MPINWNQTAIKAYRACKQDGMKMLLVLTGPDPAIEVDPDTDNYDISTGKRIEVDPRTFNTHGFIKNFEVSDLAVVNPGELEIIFHSGAVPDTIPDLLKETSIYIQAPKDTGPIYSAIDTKAVRPAGVTILYKIRAKESKDKLEI